MLTVVAGLLGAPAPPARATTLFEAMVVGQVSVGIGLGYPILTLSTSPHVLTGSPLQAAAHAIGAQGSNCLTLAGTIDSGVPSCRLIFANARPVAISSISCLAMAGHLAKSKSVVSGPLCSFSTISVIQLPNVITGHCGLNSGQVALQYVDGPPFSAEINRMTFDVTFSGGFGLVGYTVMTGHVYKTPTSGPSQRGLVVGLLVQQPPTPALTANQSCLNKTAQDFIWTGVIAGHAT